MILSKPRPSHLPHDQFPHFSEASSSTSRSPPLLAPRPFRRLTPKKAIPTASSSNLSPPSRPPSRTERRFSCTFVGCGKAYFKPSRLAEHELTHTGDRPHKCPNCKQTYLRASHLHAHLRTHLPDEARGFECAREGCEKRFWTATHLRRHERAHDEARDYACQLCSETFLKSHFLRDHITLAHLASGTKPYRCPFEGCTWSFALKQHLRAHEKTHDPTRYTCSHPSHGDTLPTFPVWSALQSHLHHDHPPTCPHEECRGRVFKSAQRLKEHLKVHAEREADLAAGRTEKAMDEGLSKREKKRRRIEVDQGGRSPKMPRLVDGEAGKEYKCEDEGCGKRFKTRFALKAHLRSTHLGIKVHTCPVGDCEKSYAYKSNRDRHVPSHSLPATPPELDLGQQVTGAAGMERYYGCPEDGCEGRFWRVYDVRRHLHVEHELALGDDEVRHLLAELKTGV